MAWSAVRVTPRCGVWVVRRPVRPFGPWAPSATARQLYRVPPTADEPPSRGLARLGRSWTHAAPSRSSMSRTRPCSGGSRPAPIRVSTTGRATTGRMPTAGRRPSGSTGWSRPEQPPRQRRDAVGVAGDQPVPRGSRAPADNPFARRAPAVMPVNPFVAGDERGDDNPFAPRRPARASVGDDGAAEAAAARPRAGRRRELREGPARRRPAGRVLPVRALDRLSAGSADA